MKISVIQSDIVWLGREQNFKSFEVLFASLSGRSDIAVLPEMFTTGFVTDPRNAGERQGGPTEVWMKDMAARYGFAICGSYIVNEGSHYFNRLLFISPDGSAHSYDKWHLFSLGGEDKSFTAGRDRIVFNYMGFRISPYICYDLRFPVWMRNRNDYDLLIVSANWPEPRIEVWDTLLKARAIENQCFVAGANRTGTDGVGIRYNGHSAVFGMKGELLSYAGTESTCSVTAELNIEDLEKFREKFPVWRDADEFDIKL
jgi:predicted amidohydrolase